MPIDENDLPKYEKKDKLVIIKEFLNSNRGTAYSAEESFETLFESDFKKYYKRKNSILTNININIVVFLSV